LLNAVTDPVEHRQRSRPNRLVSAFAAIDSYPVAAEARQRFVTALRAGETGQASVVAEADVALALDSLRLGGNYGGVLDEVWVSRTAITTDDLALGRYCPI